MARPDNGNARQSVSQICYIRCRPTALALGIVTALGATQGIEPARAQSGQLEEVVVTSRYREESLQETPLAVSAFSAENLEVRGIDEVENIGEFVPNAFIRPSGTTPFIGIRGKINGDFFANFEPTTALYIDGTYWGRQVGMNFDLFDIERVEVLRGPQGTLFGKNALAGAIRIVTARPEGDNTGYAEVRYGDYNQIEVRGGFDVPLTDNWFMRVTGVSKKRDGYIDRLDWACQMKAEGRGELAGYGDGIVGATQVATVPDFTPEAHRDGVPVYAPVFGEVGSDADNSFAFPERRETEKDELGDPEGCSFGTFRGTDSQGGRVQLRYLGDEGLDITFSADVNDDNSEAFGSVMYQGPSNLTGLEELWTTGEVLPEYGLTAETFTGGTADPNDGAFYRPPESYSTFETLDDPMNDQNFDSGAQVLNFGYSVQIEAPITDNIDLTYIGSYRELQSDFAGRSGTTQGDNTPFDDIHNFNTFDHTQVQNEIRFSGRSFGNRLDWTLGAFTFYSKDQNHANIEIEPLTFLGLFPTKLHRDQFINENASVFGHTVFNMTDRLALTGGLRWTDEERLYNINQLGILVLNDPLRTGAERTDWKLGLDYSLSDTRFVYASAATGFRSEGFQPRPWTPSQVLPFEQEEVLSYEVGYKGDFLDNRLRLNIATFLEEYDPRVVQVAAFQCNPFDAEEPGPAYFESDLTNGTLCPPGTPLAGQDPFNYSPFISAPGEVKGLEIELTANPIDNLTLSYTLGYNTFETDEDDPDAIAYRHPDALLQPETNMSAGIQYDIMLANGGRLSPRLDVAYQGENTVGDPQVAPVPENTVPSYTLYNFGMRYLSPNEDWRVGMSVRNLTDEFYWYSFANPVNGGFSVPGNPGAPRMWSFSVRRNFQ